MDMLHEEGQVLIETLWNVKFFHPYFFIFSSCGINRNIMECKVIQANRFRDKSVLIETLWNVKPVTGDEKTNAGCINRNIMECKEKQNHILSLKKCVLIETLWNVKRLLQV